MENTKLRVCCESTADWWNLSLLDLARLSEALIGPRNGGWVRTGIHRAIVDKRKFGAEAAALAEELAALSSDARGLVDGTPQSLITAAAFFHVRFENIHPLYDGNGRLGRLILAGQFYQVLGFPPAEFERRLIAERTGYQQAFKNDGNRDAHKHLVDVLGRVLGIPVVPTSLDERYSLRPLHPSKGKPRR